MTPKDRPPEEGRIVVDARQQGSGIADLPGRVWSTVSNLLLQTPHGFGDAVWRFFAITMVSSVTFGLWMAWRYPDVIQNLIDPAPLTSIEERFRRSPETEQRTMDLLASFIASHQPSDIALINWISQTGIVEIWADPRDTTHWPTSTRGVMSVNMEAAVGAMIFDKCWTGYFVTDEGPWMVCGLSNEEDLWGYVIVHWEKESDVPVASQEHLRILANRLERILFR